MALRNYLKKIEPEDKPRAAETLHGNNRASAHYCHRVRVLRIGHLSLAAEVFTNGRRPNRSVSMMAANAAIDFERNGTVVHLNN